MLDTFFKGFFFPDQFWVHHQSHQCLVHNDESDRVQTSPSEDNYLQIIFGNKLCSNILGYCLLGCLVIMLLVCILLLAI